MIYPDKSVSEWIQKYPVLEEGLPLCSCGESHLRPWLTNKSAGIECQKCGSGIWLKTKYEDNQFLLDVLTGGEL